MGKKKTSSYEGWCGRELQNRRCFVEARNILMKG